VFANKKTNMIQFVYTLFILTNFISCAPKSFQKNDAVQVIEVKNEDNNLIQTGAEQLDLYLPLLKGKKIGLVVNQTSVVGEKHLVDVLLGNSVNIRKIFVPEHGFRGDADAGEKIDNSIDPVTKIPLVSLYGDNKKPKADQLADLDVLVFDIQDVGVRFYTYISTLHYVMESAGEQNKKVIILDRPNPNGEYIDGPILEPQFKSFVGIHPIPVVHGVTVGELAHMINGEGWLKDAVKCQVEVIKVKNYHHKLPYSLPVKPSPNLPNDLSIKLYPSLCFFEGTKVSVGRGTYFPFQVIGAPDKKFGDFTFTPVSIVGMAKSPMHENKVCFGLDLRNQNPKPFTLEYIIDFYKKSGEKEKFFNNFFNLLAGTDKLKKQIMDGMSEEEIRKTWQEGLNNYKKIRDKYLLYN
jgi:uncharacterized protein YbbC (DUF1343 family)